MRTINQTVEATFVAPTIQEVITIVPLMDGLIKVINMNRAYDKYKALSKEEQDKYLKMATDKNMFELPLIIKDNNLITLQEI